MVSREVYDNKYRQKKIDVSIKSTKEKNMQDDNLTLVYGDFVLLLTRCEKVLGVHIDDT